jgi:uncharacterized HAD superfamily protein
MIAVDIDGVIADSEPHLVRGLEKFTGQRFEPSSPRTYDFRDGFDGLKLKDCLLIIEHTLLRYSNQIPVYNYDRTYLALAKIQHKYGGIHFITARDGILFHDTYRWLIKKFGSMKFKLHTVGHESDKELWMFKHDLNVIIEDRLKIVNDLQNPKNKAYLINRPWNLGRSIKGNVIRVDDLLDAVTHHLEEPNV